MVDERSWQAQRNRERLAALFEHGVEPGSEHLVRAWVFGSASDGIEERFAAQGWVISGRVPNESGWTDMPGESCYHVVKPWRIAEADIEAMTDELMRIAAPGGELSGWGLEEHWQRMVRTREPMP